jgi:peptidoglycan/xylan/chitin deacetylase (PgdA/CDA1 family)
MSWDDIRHIADHPLGTIGAHTIHHYNLRRLSDEAAEREIRDCASIIEIETGWAPAHFAYPYGHAGAVGEREVRLAREAGYASAVTTRHGVLHGNHRAHMHALPRISVNGRYQRVGYLRTMFSGVTTLANSGRRVVTV